jgi:hypothetical protein
MRKGFDEMQTFDVDFSKKPEFAPPNFAVSEPGRDEFRLSRGDDYALVKSGPDVDSEEVELAGTPACEVMICWGAQVLHVSHVKSGSNFVVGESTHRDEAPNYLIPSEKLGTTRLVLATLDATGLSLLIPPMATGRIDTAEGETLTLDQARAEGRVSAALTGAHEFSLRHGAKAALTLNGFTFRVAAVYAGKPVKRGLLASLERGVAGYF